MKYYANFNANNGTSWINDMEFTNKAEAIRSVRETAEGERFHNNSCSWYVKDESGNEIANGGMTSTGKRYRDKF